MRFDGSEDEVEYEINEKKEEEEIIEGYEIEEDDEYERLKREQEEEEARIKARKARMAEIEKRKRYKGEIEKLREKRVEVYERDNTRLENEKSTYCEEIKKLQKRIEKINSLIQECENNKEQNDIKIIAIRDGEDDDELINEAMKRDAEKSAKKVVKKPVKKVIKKDDDDDINDDSDTASVCSSKSSSGRKKRINRGKHNDWVRYFGSDTKMKMKYGSKTYYGLIVIDKRRGEYNTAGCRVENTTANGVKTAIRYKKYRLKPADDMPVGFYGDEFVDSEFKTPNDWLEALGCAYGFIKCKKSVWRTCVFYNNETEKWESLNNYDVGDIVIN